MRYLIAVLYRSFELITNYLFVLYGTIIHSTAVWFGPNVVEKKPSWSGLWSRKM